MITAADIAAGRKRFEALAPEDKRREVRDALAALGANPAWFTVIEPWIERNATAEAELHEDAGRTPAARAEHLFSMKLLRELRGLVKKELDKRGGLDSERRQE